MKLLNTNDCQPITAVLRNAGICGSKSHQVVWRTEFCVIHSSHESRAAQSRGPLAETHELTIAIIQLLQKMSNSRKKRILFQKLLIRFTFDLDLK